MSGTLSRTAYLRIIREFPQMCASHRIAPGQQQYWGQVPGMGTFVVGPCEECERLVLRCVRWPDYKTRLLYVIPEELELV